jgi:anthranilate 1,2-dioxygenase large subunit
MEDTEATELVQRGTVRDADETSFIEMSRSATDDQHSAITEKLVRHFWVGYQGLMGFGRDVAMAEGA